MNGSHGRDGTAVDLRRGVLVGNDGSMAPVENGWLDLTLGGGQLPHGITLKDYSGQGRPHVIRGLVYTTAAAAAVLELLSDAAFPLTLRARGKGMEVVRDRAALARKLGSAFLYHGTCAPRLKSIAARGLEPSSGSEWSADPEDPELGEWSMGKVFFAASAEEARAYAAEKADMIGGAPEIAVVRVAIRDLRDVQWDRMGRGGDVFVTHPVPARALRVERGGAWVRVDDPGLRAVLLEPPAAAVLGR